MKKIHETQLIEVEETKVESSVLQRYNIDINNVFLPASILLSAIILSGSLIYIHKVPVENISSQAGTSLTAQNATKPVQVDIGDSPILGNSKAAVTIVEFGDFQCPFCKKYFDDNESRLVQDYVNTGKASFVWKDYAFLGQESTWAAEAARCASEQNKFWEYHDYLYAHQGAENSGAFAKEKLKGFAAILGLNQTQFNSCLDTDKFLDAVNQSKQYGVSMGVRGTPATFVNGNLLGGAVPYDTLKTAVETALKGK